MSSAFIIILSNYKCESEFVCYAFIAWHFDWSFWNAHISGSQYTEKDIQYYHYYISCFPERVDVFL